MAVSISDAENLCLTGIIRIMFFVTKCSHSVHILLEQSIRFRSGCWPYLFALRIRQFDRFHEAILIRVQYEKNSKTGPFRRNRMFQNMNFRSDKTISQILYLFVHNLFQRIND